MSPCAATRSRRASMPRTPSATSCRRSEPSRTCARHGLRPRCASIPACARATRSAADPWSPWHRLDTWWPNSSEHALALRFEAGGGEHAVCVRTRGDGVCLTVGEREIGASVARARDGLRVQLEGTETAAEVVARGEDRYVFCAGEAD